MVYKIHYHYRVYHVSTLPPQCDSLAAKINEFATFVFDDRAVEEYLEGVA